MVWRFVPINSSSWFLVVELRMFGFSELPNFCTVFFFTPHSELPFATMMLLSAVLRFLTLNSEL
jgi:hypothetical protein